MKYRIAGLLLSILIAFQSIAEGKNVLPVIALELKEPPLETTVIHEDTLEDYIEQSEIINADVNSHESLKHKIHDIFDLQVSDNEHVEPLLGNILNKKFEKGPFDNIGISGLWRGALVENFSNGDNRTNMHYDIVESRLHGTFRDHKTSFIITTRYVPQKEFSFMQNLFSDTFIRHRFSKKAVLTIGNTRTHTGEEGSWGELLIPFYFRSQISSHFGNIRKLGVRLSGETKYIDYDIAGNTSGTYFTSFFPGAEFCGWVNFKPLANTNGKYGDVKVGAGLTAGRRHFNYNNVGAYISYRYKKFMFDFECANADGYNGRLGYAKTHARGYYTTLYYDIHNKLQLVARFDSYTPDCHDSHHQTREYSAGLNYFIKGQALKFILNYVFREDSIAGNSHRIIVGTQVVL